MRCPIVPVPSYRLPCAGSEVTLKRSGSLLGSEPVRVTVVVVSWLSDTDWALATGGSLTGMDTVADAVPPLPSLMVYVNESGPKRSEERGVGRGVSRGRAAG